MTTSNGHSETGRLPHGSDPSLPKRRPAGALLSDTADEIAELFRLQEAFPFAPKEEDDDVEVVKPSWWARVASWFGWRPAGPGEGRASPGGGESGAAAEGVGRAGAERRGGASDDDAAPPAWASIAKAADRSVAQLPGTDVRRDRIRFLYER